MRVVRKITYEGTEEQLERQLRHSAPNGKWLLSKGFLKRLSIKIETLEEPDSSRVHRAIEYHPRQWPIDWMVKGE